MDLTASWDAARGRVILDPGDLDDHVTYRIERTWDGGTTWNPVRGAQNITTTASVRDYEYAPNRENCYRLVGPTLSDAFERTESGTWGDADTGQTWSTINGTAANLAVDDGQGTMIVPITQGIAAPDDGDATVDTLITGTVSGTVTVVAWVRASSGTANGYGVRTVWNVSAGTVQVTLMRFDGGIPTLLAPAVTLSQGWFLGQVWRLRVRYVGTGIAARVWPVAAPEPGHWHVAATDATYATGDLAVRAESSTGGYVHRFNGVRVEAVPPDHVEACVTPTPDVVWFKSLAFPTLSMPVGCILTGERTRRARGGPLDVTSRADPVAVADYGLLPGWVVQVTTHTREDSARLAALITYGTPWLLQPPGDDDPDACAGLSATPGGYVVLGDNVERRPVLGRPGWVWSIPVFEVAPPDIAITPTDLTWRILWGMAATWLDLWDRWDSWADMWETDLDFADLRRVLTIGGGPGG